MFTSFIKNEDYIGSHLACGHKSVVVSREITNVSVTVRDRTFDHRNVLRLILESGVVVFIHSTHASNPLLTAKVGSQLYIAPYTAMVITMGAVILS